jgi:hypothetical protein
VSRSSALASKATGFPIAKVAAKLAVGYTLDELDELKSLLLQVDQKLGVSQLLLMSTLSDFTLSKRKEMLDKSLIAEPLNVLSQDGYPFPLSPEKNHE